MKTIQVYGIEEITGPVDQLDKKVIEDLFPGYDASALIRSPKQVDLLIGTDAYGLHCRKEVAKAGENLFIMEGPLGATLIGHHHRLKDILPLTKNVPRKVHKAHCGMINMTLTDRQVQTNVPGEKKADVTNVTKTIESDNLIRDYKSIHKYDSAVRVIARVISVTRKKSFAGGQEDNLTPELINEAEIVLIKEVQKGVDTTHLKKLNPGTNGRGLKIVGANRLKEFNPLGMNSEPQIFLPKNHPLTKLAMVKAHQNGHFGKDGTLASFRSKFWTSRGPHVAASAKSHCQFCKRRNPKLLEQVIRRLPEAKFNHCMVDLFGPNDISGDVKKRATGKAWKMESVRN